MTTHEARLALIAKAPTRSCIVSETSQFTVHDDKTSTQNTRYTITVFDERRNDIEIHLEGDDLKERLALALLQLDQCNQ